MYIYVYIYVYIHVYIYIHIYRGGLTLNPERIVGGVTVYEGYHAVSIVVRIFAITLRCTAIRIKRRWDVIREGSGS